MEVINFDISIINASLIDLIINSSQVFILISFTTGLLSFGIKAIYNGIRSIIF